MNGPVSSGRSPYLRNRRGRHFRRAGAAISGTMSNWTDSLVSQLLAERQKRRVSDRAWDLYTNDAMAHGLLESVAVEAVGIGLTPQPVPDLDWLDIPPARVAEYQSRVSRLFAAHCLDCRCFCDATRRQDFYGLQLLGYFYWRLDGIGLFQVLQDKTKLSPLGTALLPIDPYRLATPTTGVAAGEIYDGVEIDRNGKPVAAWIRKPEAPASAMHADSFTRVPMEHPATGLPRMLLLCDVRNIAEYRQDGMLSSVIKEIRDNNDFVEAALVRAVIANMFVAFIKNFGNSAPKTLDWNQRVVEMDKGTVLQGAAGEEAEFYKHDGLGAGFDTIFSGIIKRIGMATGRGPENVSREYKASFSASRASMVKADQFNEVEQGICVRRMCQPYMCWLQYEAVLRGLLPVQGRDHFLEHLYFYTQTNWMPQPKRHIDPEKAAKSDATRLDTNTRTYAEICGEKGLDWKKHLEQVAEEKAYIRSLENQFGISMSVSAGPGTDNTESGAENGAEEKGDSDEESS